MARSQKKRPSWILSILPRSKQGRMAFGVFAFVCVAGSAYYAGMSTYSMETAAKRFVDTYQNIDQRPYRSAL